MKHNRVSEFQSRWPSYQDFADDAEVSYGTAQQWRHRNRIPESAWPAILRNAPSRGINIDWRELDLLEQLARDERGGNPPSRSREAVA